MSHFAVAVLSDGKKSLKELLAPYQENSDGTPDKKYLKFFSTEDENRQKYSSEGRAYILCEDSVLRPPYDDYFKKANACHIGFCTADYEVPEDLRRVEVPYKLLYPTFESFMSEYCGVERDEEAGEYGYWENPNAKWDWFSIGGRFIDLFNEKIGGVHMRVKDIAFDADKQRRKAERYYDSGGCDSFDFALRTRGLDRERYVELESHLHFRACITPDGEWHEVGEMGWFGMSSETSDEMYEWAIHFRERFLNDPDLMLTVVDCHI